MPLRLKRLVMATAAIGLAVAWTALSGAPAMADQVRHQEWWLANLHVPQAWKTSKGAGVTVALLDTGVDPGQGQPDIFGSVIAGKDFTNSGEQQGSQFFGIHGTAMASLIVGHGHGPGDSAGIMGVAPDARLLSVRVTLDAGDPQLLNSAVTSNLPNAIAAGIRYAVANGAQVIDLPLDPGQTPSDLIAPTPAPTPSPKPSPSTTPPPDGTAAEQAAVAYALSQGVVLVAPAGDNGNGTDAPNFPADYPGVISVGAFDSNTIKAPFSSHQPYVTLTAPGDGMTAEVPPNTYSTVSSTSAASAIVTGIAALIKSQFPELTPAQVTRALIRGTRVRPKGGLADGSGHGTVDAARALAAAATIAAPSLHRAGDGALSSGGLPAAPSASPLAGESLRPKLERDGLISLAVLVVLLLPILAYWLRQRRRRRARALARAEQEHAARGSFAQNGDGTADMMREYFATLPGQPGRGGARSAAAAPGGPRATLAEPPFGPADEVARRAPVQIPRSPLTPITRAGTPRPPKVSGSPPWEPAPKPEGEVPWASSPAPAARGRHGAHAAPATSSVWAVATPGGQGADIHGEQAGDSDDGTETGGRPIYVWNPSETTETFPQVPRDGRDAGS